MKQQTTYQGEWKKGVWNPKLTHEQGYKNFIELQEIYFKQKEIKEKIQELNSEFRSLSQKAGQILRGE